MRFLRWGLTREWLAHRAVWLGLLVGAVALSVAAVLPPARPVGIAVAWLVSAAAAQFTWRWTSPKRPLVMTARMRRLLIAGGFLAVLLAAGLALGIVALHPIVSTILVLIAAGLVTGMSEILLVAANVVTKPAEARIRRHYLDLAARRLHEVDPVVVAVVGSYREDQHQARPRAAVAAAGQHASNPQELQHADGRDPRDQRGPDIR